MNNNLAPMTADAIYAAIAALSPAQQTMLTEISKYAEPVTVTTLANALTLHPNSVRATLDSLISLHLVDRQPMRRQSRGRPSWGYFALAPDSASFAFTQMVELANIFCDILRDAFDDPAAQARSIGRIWGDRLVAQIQRECCIDPNDDVDIDARISQMRVLYTSLGMSAAINGAEPNVIDLRACPFITRDSDLDPLICDMHSGLVERIMECSCGCANMCKLRPMREPGVCQIEVSGIEDAGLEAGEVAGELAAGEAARLEEGVFA